VHSSLTTGPGTLSIQLPPAVPPPPDRAAFRARRRPALPPRPHL